MMVCVLFNIILPVIITVCAITQDTDQRKAHAGWNLHICKAIVYLDGVGLASSPYENFSYTTGVSCVSCFRLYQPDDWW